MNDVGVIYTLPGCVVVTQSSLALLPFCFNGVFVRTFTFDSLEAIEFQIEPTHRSAVHYMVEIALIARRQFLDC